MTTFAERTNALPYSATENPAPTVVFPKAKGCRDFRFKMSVRPMAFIATGKVIEINVVVIGVPRIGSGEQLGPFRQAKYLTEDIDPQRWHDLSFLFRGWPLDAYMLTCWVERRNDTTWNGLAPSQANLLLRQVIGISENRVPGD